MQKRMTSPAQLIPAALKGIHAYGNAANDLGVPETTLIMTHLQASQINGCSVCVELHANHLKKVGETDERIYAVGAWFDAPYFTDAERAALALTEAVTRLSDRTDPVSDDLWAEVSKHYDEQGIAALLISISSVNVWNRLNVATRQVAGEWKP